MKKILFRISCYLLWCTWGILDGLYGLIIFLFTFAFAGKIKYQDNIITVKIGKTYKASGWAFEAGAFVFSNTDAIFDTKNSFFKHEWGHCIPQTWLCGPLHIFLCGIPSVIRFQYREYLVRSGKKKRSELKPYDAAWFEGTATKWGTYWNNKLKEKGWL